MDGKEKNRRRDGGKKREWMREGKGVK